MLGVTSWFIQMLCGFSDFKKNELADYHNLGNAKHFFSSLTDAQRKQHCHHSCNRDEQKNCT